MKLLAVDTSSIVATVAVMDEDKLIAEAVINNQKNHSQRLMPLIKEVLDNSNLSPADIDVYAAALGPGSFTGLRIGITTVKAMAQAMNKPVVGISTLDSLAYNLPFCNSYICPIIDAQRNNAYTALYIWDNNGIKLHNEHAILHIDELIKKIKTLQRTTIFLGDGINIFKDKLNENLGSLGVIAPSSVAIPRASSVAALAIKKAKAGELVSPEEIVPIYMRKSQAEKQFEEKFKG
ncbi:tRNA (adenosine(37)-N6)-threonylcarbamoyltransferase complex dimerization subunit type 1 TsaB [Alkaliphilus pronyensis]|uniref:tRNA (Adenosine(37)-N6)-threonylcarbamoyltransferase complex dimerization subunit type 1 TsaB n=1 Tax=Alkaliphilus pronyensis TaxID=1482732 RepID=A0A6I0EZH1_9FIRM|nr:tRNA (adenosine(37)-N6)-threonylcarbamoyltransferase complex dimerization subunit type 1 TsaB [Alkaliphilus pronyensis]KAB3532423.1 tRNA (adenosine(37)-N6)-threonylcarbamoyltransferase complex dimerization subunit type 1 TsaB [Alkaliphilus pronyensis]